MSGAGGLEGGGERLRHGPAWAGGERPPKNGLRDHPPCPAEGLGVKAVPTQLLQQGKARRRNVPGVIGSLAAGSCGAAAAQEGARKAEKCVGKNLGGERSPWGLGPGYGRR